MDKNRIESLIPITRIVVVREGNIYVPGEYDLVKAKLQAAKDGDTPIRGYFELYVLAWLKKTRMKNGGLRIDKSYSNSNGMGFMTFEKKTIQNSKVTSINQCSWEESPAAIYDCRTDNPWAKGLLKKIVVGGLMTPVSSEPQKED